MLKYAPKYLAKHSLKKKYFPNLKKIKIFQAWKAVKNTGIFTLEFFGGT
jgi:hypothetical protein